MFRASLVILLISACAGRALAQRPGGGQGGPPIGRVYGKVIDATTRKPAEYATVSLFAGRVDSLLTGTLVRGNGDFELTGIRPGQYRLRISFIGYTPLERPVSISRDRPEVDVGNLELAPDAELLKEVEVLGERSSMVMKVDRRVYNVDKDLSAKGGTAEDVMKNIPGLSVDVDGNVQLRNASPQVMVDGRPTTMTLDQIRAEEIERVEVITNPSVAFDANTTGGLVNVVLKKNDKPGYSGSVQAGAGTNDRYQGSGNLQVKEGRLNLNLSYNVNTAGNRVKSYTHRNDLLADQVIGTFEQDGDNRNTRAGQGGRASLDWAVDNRNTFTVEQSIRTRDYGTRETQTFTTTDGSGTLTGRGTQRNDQNSDGTDMTSRLGFRRTGPEEDKLLTMDVTYNRSRRTNDARFAAEAFDPLGAPWTEGTFTQTNEGLNNNDQWTFQADMSDPMGDRNKLEYGVKASFADKRSLLNVFNLDPDNGTPVPDSLLTNDYRIQDNIMAAYLNWMHRIDDHWSVQAGVRYEMTRFTGTLEGKGVEFVYNYPSNGQDLDKALFPAVYLVRRWDREGGRELQFNLSRKISRPNFWQIYPFISFRDARSYRIGNPALAPEVSTLAEVNHLLPFGERRGNWFTSLYGRVTDDVITGYTYVSPVDSGILVNTFVNGDRSWTLGWENSIRFSPLTNLDVTVSGVAQYSEVSTPFGPSNAGWSGEAKCLIAWRLPKDLSVQANGDYEFPRIIPQGTTLAVAGLDLSLNKDFGRKWSVSASVNDVFNQRRWGTRTSGETFDLETWRRREQRNLRVTLTWRFGERDVSFFRRNRNQRREPGMDGGDGDM